jgi:hypothetical protein
MNRLTWCGVAALSLACISCGDSNNLHPVSGAVSYKGQPAAGAAVFFRRQSGDSMNDHAIMGIVLEDGSFSLVCGSLGKGAPTGEYDVLIEWKQDLKQGKRLAQKGHDRLKGRYADPKRPRLHALVKAESNRLPPFELTD